MDPIDEALAKARLYDAPNLSAIATEFSVDRTKLWHRYRGTRGTMKEKHENQSLLLYAQQDTLVSYINQLTERGLPPTPAMVGHFAEDICKHRPHKGWVLDFVRKHADVLMAGYLRPLDAARKKADSSLNYELYFTLLQAKSS